MTERKPAGESREHWIDRLIREAEARGEFDDLPGAGKPIPDLKKPYDELWWLKRLLEREQLSVTPSTLALRKEVEAAVDRIRKAGDEAEVRRIAAEINEKISAVNAKATSGPPTHLAPLDSDAIVRQWRDRRRAT